VDTEEHVDILLGALALLLVAVTLLYNQLVRARVRVRQAWAQVETQLQRRHDLIPNLVATVRGYATHERELLDAVVSARTRALTTTDPLARGVAEDELGSAVATLLAVAESYPQLQADGNFLALQHELRDTEDRIAFARGFANDRVARYRELTDTLPGKLVAGPLRLPREQLFALEHERAGSRPDVRLEG
jgi:LemA protein